MKMICDITTFTIDSERKKKLFGMVVSDLLEMTKQKKAFNLKDYMRSIYDVTLSRTGRKDIATVVTAIVPGHLNTAYGLNDDAIQDLLIDHLKEIRKVSKEITTTEQLFQYMEIAPIEDDGAHSDQIEQEKIKEKKALNLLNVNNAPAFSARPNSINTTIGNEEDAIASDPKRVHSYDFLDYLTSKGQTTSDQSGFYLTLVHGNSVFLNNATDNPSYGTGLLQVITNADGEVIYFDDLYNQVDQAVGKPVFFRFREDFKKIQTAEEIQKTRGLTAEQYKDVIKAEQALVATKKSYMQRNPDGFIIQEIKIISNGYLPKGSDKLNISLEGLEDLSSSIIEVDILDNDKQRYYIKRSNNHDGIPFKTKAIADITGLAEDGARIILGDFENSNTPSNIQYRRDIIDVFFANNPTVRIVQKKKTNEYVTQIKVNGKILAVYKSDLSETQLNEAIQKVASYLLSATITDEKGTRTLPHALNIFKGDQVAFYKKENGKLIPTQISKKEYQKFLFDNSYTDRKTVDGKFVDLNGYIGFSEIVSEHNKMTKQSAAVYTSKGETINPKIEVVKQTAAAKKAAKENKGIYSMRPNATDDIPGISPEQNYGNPWSVKGYQNTIIAEGTTEEEKLQNAASNYKKWLEGSDFQFIEQERRKWILDQIDSGKLDNATFIYFKSGYYSHADALVDFIKERRGVTTTETTTTAAPTTPVTTVKEKKQRRSFGATQVNPEDVAKKFDKLQAQGRVFDVTPEQLETARLWYESHPMSSYVPFEVMFDAINTANPKSIATFYQGAITLYKGSNYTDVYHEAWHAFTQMFLSDKQRNALYLDLSKRKGTFVTYDGKTVNFNDPEYQRLKKIKSDKLTEEEALYVANKEKEYEEFLAEDFREFMLNEGKFKKEDSPEKKSIFQFILDILKLMFNVAEEDMVSNNQASKMLHEMYVNLAIGNIGSPKFTMENSNLGTFDKIKPINDVDIALGDAISYKDAKLLVDSIDSIFSQFIDTMNLGNEFKNYTSLVLGDLDSRAQLYTEVYNQLNKRYGELQVEILSYEEGSIEYVDINRKIDLLEFALSNFSIGATQQNGIITGDDVIASIESGNGVISYHTSKSKYLTFEEKFIEDPDNKLKNDRDGFSHKAGNEVSMKDLAQKELLYVLRSLFAYDKDEVVKNDLGFNELIKFDSIWNKLQRNMAGIYDIDEQLSKLKSLAKNDKSIEQLISKLGSIIPEDKENLFQMNLWTYFNQTFGVKRIPLVQVTINIDSNNSNDIDGIQVTVGKAKRESASVGRKWEANFKNPALNNISGSLIKISNDPKLKRFGNILDTEAVIEKWESQYKKNPVGFLNAIGMDIDPSSTEITAEIMKGNLKMFAKNIFERLKLFAENDIPVKSISDIVSIPITKTAPDGTIVESNEEGAYQKLLDLVYDYSDEYGGAMVTNAAGSQQWEYSLRSTISQRIDALNAASSYNALIADEKMKDFDVNKNPHMRGLITLRTLFGEDYGNKQMEKTLGGRDQVANIQLENSAGVTTTINNLFAGIGVASADNDELGSTLQNLYMSILYNTSASTQHADKSTAYLYKLLNPNGARNYIAIGDFATNLNEIDKSDPTKAYMNSSRGMAIVVNQFMQYLDSEIARIHRLQNGDASGNALVGDKTYKEVGSDFVTFQDILSTNNKKTLLKSFISDNFLDEIKADKNVKLRESIQTDIINYLKSQMLTFQADINQVGLLSNSNLMTPLRNKMKTSVGEIIYNQEAAKDISKIDDSIIMAYIANDWIHKYESTVMYYGDPALYHHQKEEFHKRNAGVAATGAIPRTDAKIISMLSGTMKGKYAESTWYKGPAVERIVNDKFNTAILEDSVSPSVYINMYIDAAYNNQIERQERNKGKKLTKTEKEKIRKQVESDYSEYRKMKEADGQGWISFDSYRDLLMRLGKWSQYQESVYNKIINNEDISGIDIATFFPVKKMQYWGPLKTADNELPLIGFHKFSLMPLIPTLIKGTQLEALHNKMVSQNIDYTTMVTGSKINTITKNGKADLFYTDRANEELAFTKDDYTFTPNTIFLDYFKDQLEVPDKFKGSVIFSTQMRKLIEEGLMENGVPTDWELNIKDTNERIAKWNALDDTEKSKSRNYSAILNYESLVRKLTEHKKRELIKEAGIKYSDKDKAVKLTPDFLDFVKKELSSQDLAEHEIDFIEYDPGTGKLKYDLSIHPSADKIERLLTAMVYKRLVRQKVKGEALVQVSGVGFQSIQFNKATKEDINKYGTDGLSSYTQELDSKGNVIATNAMKVKISIQGDFKKLLKHKDVLDMVKKNEGMTALEALNTLIKDKKWLNEGENRRMVSIAGVRIPVQGLNSMEFAEVYEFLPETSGNIIIVPSEIVAKSGADFDIDKLTMMFPSISFNTSAKGGVELTKYDAGLAERFDKKAAKEKMLELKKKKIAAYKEIEDEIAKQLGGKEYKAYIKEQFETYKKKVKEYRKEVDDARYNDDLVMQTFYESQIDDLVAELRDNTFVTLKRTLLDDISLEQKVIRADIEKASSYGIENELLGSIIDILSKPENFSSLTRPNTTDVLKPLADEYSEWVSDYNPFDTLTNKNGASFKRGDKNIIAGTRIFEIGYNRYKQVSNMIGKQALGIGAVDNTYNVLFNRINVYLNPIAELGGKKKYKVPQRILMAHNFITDPNGEKAISLAKSYDVNNKYKISDLISQAINGWVDVAKDAWIFFIQGNKEISPTLLFLLQAGVDVEQAVAFVSQPLVREYVKNMRLAKSAFGKALGVAPANPNDYRIVARRKVIMENNFEYNGDVTSTFTQKRVILESMAKDYLGDVTDFSTKDLKDRIINYSKGDKQITDVDRAAFIHFLEIEEMAKAITEVKQTMNFDTSKSPSLYDARMRLKKKFALENNDRLTENIVEKIEKSSPIGSFGIQEFTIKLLTNFFNLRDNELFNNFVDEFTSGADLADYGATFKDKETLAEAFKNDFTSYIFQQFLNSKERFKPEDAYKSMRIVKKDFETVSKSIVPVNFMKFGAYVDGNTLYASLDQIQRDYASKEFEKDKYEKETGLAPVNADYFVDLNQYIKFVYERETLRSMIPMSEYRNMADYRHRAKQFKGLEKEVKLRKSYEAFLRDTALINKMNIDFMMLDDNGYAKNVMNLIESYPKLAEQYPVLSSLIFVDGAVKNLKLSESKLDGDLINIYNSDLEQLADPTVVKVKNKFENERISNLFSMFPIFAFFQSGQDRVGAYAISRIVPTELYAKLLVPAIQEVNKTLSDAKKAEKYLMEYSFLFNTLYSEGNRNDERDFVEDSRGGYNPFKKRMKRYYYGDGVTSTRIGTLGILSSVAYNTDIRTYHKYDTEGELIDIEEFKEKITKLIKNNPNIVLVVDMAVTGKGQAGKNYSNSVILDLVKEGKIPESSVIGIMNKKTGYVVSSDDTLSDSDYNKNIKNIDVAIEKIKKAQKDQKILIYDADGLGQSLLGYGLQEKSTQANKLKKGKTSFLPAPKTFVYLSERLYELGFINPNYTKAIKKMESDSEVIDFTKKQKFTDEEVRRRLLECLNAAFTS